MYFVFVGFNGGIPRTVCGLSAYAAVFLPYVAEGEGLQLLLQHHQLGEIALVLQLFELCGRLKQCIKQRLLNVAHARDQRRDTVDGSIKIVGGQEHAIQRVVAYQFLGDLAGLVVKQHHVVGVPTHGTSNMQSHILVEQKQGRDLVGNQLGGLIMAVVHQRSDAGFVGVGQTELCRADGVGLQTDTEHLGFQGDVDLFLIVRNGEDLIQRFLEAAARADAVGGQILVAVGDPDIHNAGNAGLVGEIFCDLQAGLAMLDPELTHLVNR